MISKTIDINQMKGWTLSSHVVVVAALGPCAHATVLAEALHARHTLRLSVCPLGADTYIHTEHAGYNAYP